MRYLIARPRGHVSRWMSLAPIFSASYSVERTRRTTWLVSSLMLLSDRSSTRALSAAPPTAASSRTASSARSVSSWLAR